MATSKPSISAPFPPSGQKLIMDYHRAHSNSLRLAHHIGQHGAEKVFPFLADYFQHLHLSIPGRDELLAIREETSNFHAENWWKSKFSFSQTKQEECHLAVAKGSVDLCFIMAPFDGRVGEVVDAVAESLAPNGTMVVVSTARGPVLVSGDERVREAVRKLYEFWGRGLVGVRQWNSPLDYVPLRHEQGDEVWIQDVTKRIKIGFPGKDDGVFVIPGTEEVAESQVGPEQRKFWFGGDDAEGKGWRFEADASWFREHIAFLGHRRTGVYEELLQEVEQAIRETTEDGKVRMEWPAAILLATRK